MWMTGMTFILVKQAFLELYFFRASIYARTIRTIMAAIFAFPLSDATGCQTLSDVRVIPRMLTCRIDTYTIKN